MAYEPTNWKAGDIVTSAKLNKIEQGIATNKKILIADFNQDNGALNKTWQEIYDADISFIRIENENLGQKSISPVIEMRNTVAGCFIVCFDSESTNFTVIFTANSPDDYPILAAPETEDAGDEGK